MKKNKLIESVTMTVLALVFTILLKCVDVSRVEATGGLIAFSSINIWFNNIFSFNQGIYRASEILGYIAFIPVLVFGVMGLVQLLKTKSFKKVDSDLYALLLSYVIVGVVYIFFDKVVVINLRPIIMDGETIAAASYPSSHTLLSTVIFGTALIECGRLKDKKTKNILTIVLFVLMVSLIVTRAISGVHWLTDIIGALLWGEAILLFFQYVLLLFREK